MPQPTPPSTELLERIERAILAFEVGGDAALQVELQAAGPMAPELQQQIDALRAANLLMPPQMPESIGGWRVLQRLGSGGMGSVFLGEQHEPIARRGAIKVIRDGMNSHEVLARFALERQALALLDHPGIARILDAGRLDDGRPFLVMDYVPGLGICRYCDERQLDTRARLQVFVQVCDAVQHAHQKGLLHRDLKPSNILVGDRDGAPFPVVIDFGVAKSVGAQLGHVAMTLPGHLLGTPEYMSPEQAQNREDVDTRTDVYSLGVVLYELLTSTLPIDAKELRSDVGKALREAEPPTPSTRITALGNEAATIAARRRASIGALRRALRGDLDWIVMKALERDRNRRYGMPGELAADIRRHLADEPVTAGAPTAWYRLRKYCIRHRLGVATAGAIATTLLAGLTVSTVFWQEARASAANSAASLDAALHAVGELVQVGDSDLVAVPHLDHVRRDLMDRAMALYSDFLARGASADPRLLLRTLDTRLRLGEMEMKLGQLAAGEQHFRAVATTLATPAAAALPAPWRADAECEVWTQLAVLADRRSEADAALAFVALAQAVPMPVAEDAASDLRRTGRAVRLAALHANVLAGRNAAAAVATIEPAVAVVRELAARQPAAAGMLAMQLRIGADRANLLRLAGRPDEAFAVVQELLAMRARHAQRNEWPVAQAMLTLAGVLDSCERAEAVLDLVAEMEPTFRQLVTDHPSIIPYRMAALRLVNLEANAQLLQKQAAVALVTMRRLRDGVEEALAQAPQDTTLLRQLILACMNIVTIHDDGRRRGRDWDAVEVADALSRARQALDVVPAGTPQREVRPLRMEVLRLTSLLHESRGEAALALACLGEAITIGEALVADSNQGIEFRTRLVEMQRIQSGQLLDQHDAPAALPIVTRALAASRELRDQVAGKARWHSRHREILLLAARAHAATGDGAAAGTFLDEHKQLGSGPPGEAPDWVGHQESGRALAKIVAALPAASPDRATFLARGRATIADGLACAGPNLDGGTSPAMVAVMAGNTHLVARDLEAAAGEFAAAARAAGAAIDEFATGWQQAKSERNEVRLATTVQSQIALLARAGDAAGIAATGDRARGLFAERAATLANVAAGCLATTAGEAESTTAARRAVAVELLRAARTAGLDAAVLREPRFAPLHGDVAFEALVRAEPPSVTGK